MLAYNGYGLLALLYWNLGVTLLTCIVAFIDTWPRVAGIRIFIDFFPRNTEACRSIQRRCYRIPNSSERIFPI